MSEESGEKSHSASEKRREEYAERGQVARSKELLGAAVLSVTTLMLVAWGAQLAYVMQRGVLSLLGDLHHPLDRDLLWRFGSPICQVALPVAVTAAASALLTGIVQARGSVNFRAPGFDLSRIDVLARLGQMFNPKESGVSTLMSLGKIFLLGIVFYNALYEPLMGYVVRVPVSLQQGLTEAGGIFRHVLHRGLLAMLTFGALDFAHQWYKLEQKMRMSSQELKEEAKEANGDGRIKGRRRKFGQELIRRRSLQAVPKADVVVVNPTHYAVAIKYDANKMDAPVVVAKGVDTLAARIRQIARRHGVPVVSQPPLARTLYAQVKVGRGIPAELYQAVAVVLAHVYRIGKRAS